MVEKINPVIQQTDYNTTSSIKKLVENKPVTAETSTHTAPSFCASRAVSSNNNVNFRTELSGRDEKKMYTTVVSKLDKKSRKLLDNLLKTGILLNSESNDKSTVLENLYKIATEPRAQGLSNTGILKDTVLTLAYPYIITQQFGDIPPEYRQRAIDMNNDGETNLIRQWENGQKIDVKASGTCVAASTEFKLAKQLPAEFARFAQGLSSPEMAVDKTIRLDNLADETLDALWLLNTFETNWEPTDFNSAKITFKPDKNAILRAQIQTTHKDPYERSPLDVLMQSTFMQTGSQQSYNTITDKRTGKFNQNDKGLIEFEKTFTESVVFDKNILSVTYQKVDENARLVGYETDLATTKRHLLTALDEGENILIGYTQTDNNNIIINGHEITIVGYKKDNNGKVTFICNDTDDDISEPIAYSEDYLLPKIHHAALPKHIVENDVPSEPLWRDGINEYKQMKTNAV